VKIPITRPLFGKEEREAVADVLESGWVVQGPRVAEFERLFGEYAKVKHALATTSCTTALHLALRVLSVQPGDEVIVPAYTFVASANVVEQIGARPVFCDIDLATFNTTKRAMESAVSERTRVVMPISLFGLQAPVHEITDWAHAEGLAVVEDAACAIGAWRDDRHAGTVGDIGCVSFHPRKAITTGEGGMLLTENAEMAEKALALRNHGAVRTDLERHTAAGSFLLPEYPFAGFNYRMTDLQGAVGVVQMSRLRGILDRRRQLASFYDAALREFGWLQTPARPSGSVHGYQSYVCLFTPETPSLGNVERLHGQRNRLMLELEEKGIATRQGTQAVHTTTYYRERYGLSPEDFPNSYIADRLSLALPLYPQMSEAEQSAVVSALEAAG
jgi:perosamine synthetase